MKSSIFWDITPCSLVGFNRRLEGTYLLHLQGRRVSQEMNQTQQGASRAAPFAANFSKEMIYTLP
jgi:hypothetical protein